MSTFLENLKKSVENGEFNSEAAKKIIEIDKLAEEKIKLLTKTGQSIEDSDLAKTVDDRVKKAGVKIISEEEALELNSQYEKKMEEIKKQDAANQQLATIIDIEDMVKLSIGDMMTFVAELENKFDKTEPIYKDLLAKLEEIKIKYNSIINN
jgi:tRNA splicing endonuclease